VRAKATTANKMLVEWRDAGLSPLSPRTVLEKLPTRTTSVASLPHALPQQTDRVLSLLDSSSTDGTQLREVKALLNSAIKAANDLPSPVQRYT